MKKTNIIFILIIVIFIILIKNNISYAENVINITSNKSIIDIEEELEIKVELNNTSVAAFTIELYWDTSKLKYVSGPDNSNNVNNRVIYTWINESGKNKDNILIEGFKFISLQNGIANIMVTEEFYDENGNIINIDDSNIEIKIGKDDTKEIINEQLNVSDDNSNLKILRLNHEGISPVFDKYVKEYYFIANSNIQNLDVTAIPEDTEATVTISGNNNLKMGENIIDIEVESKNKTKTSIYKIYVTRTENIEKANANLETLAVRQGTLEPEFDNSKTKYNVEISNSVEKIDILAIPQKENATVKILGNGELKVGDNNIQVIVTAENGTTNKKYDIFVHRRNEEEEIKYKEEQEYQAERLSSILEGKKDEIQNKNDGKENNEKMKFRNLIIVLSISVVLIVSTIVIYKIRIKKIKK